MNNVRVQNSSGVDRFFKTFSTSELFSIAYYWGLKDWGMTKATRVQFFSEPSRPFMA